MFRCRCSAAHSSAPSPASSACAIGTRRMTGTAAPAGGHRRSVRNDGNIGSRIRASGQRQTSMTDHYAPRRARPADACPGACWGRPGRTRRAAGSVPKPTPVRKSRPFQSGRRCLLPRAVQRTLWRAGTGRQTGSASGTAADGDRKVAVYSDPGRRDRVVGELKPSRMGCQVRCYHGDRDSYASTLPAPGRPHSQSG
jgi:hypothetical protein